MEDQYKIRICMNENEMEFFFETRLEYEMADMIFRNSVRQNYKIQGYMFYNKEWLHLSK